MKLRMLLDNEYDEEGNRVHNEDDEDEEEREDHEEEEEEVDEDVQPSDDDETFYSSYAPEADVKDEDEDTSGLSVLE